MKTKITELFNIEHPVINNYYLASVGLSGLKGAKGGKDITNIVLL